MSDAHIEPQGLKLLAKDTTDLTVLASCIQDALAPVGDIAWLEDEGRFVLALNRFMWEQPEHEADGASVYHRTHAILTIDSVTSVRSRGYGRADVGRMLSLLSMRPTDTGLDLLFADNAQIHLEAPEIAVALEDVGDPWPTRWKPAHADDATASRRKPKT